MSPSFLQILIVVILIVLLFGRGKISDLMGDIAKGIKSFKQGMAEDDKPERREPPKNITHENITHEKPETASEHEGEHNKTS